MAYEKVEWINDETRLNEENMNSLENRIAAGFNEVDSSITNLTNRVVELENKIPDTVLFTTTAPTAPNENGGLKFVVLDSEPETKYSGWFYLIRES